MVVREKKKESERASEREPRTETLRGWGRPRGKE